ncbi:MAG: hypothetical protein ABJD53_06960 [Gammaproteobacteria bacterium]
MNTSDETLMAYVDGELDQAARQEVESVMRDDPQVHRRVAQHRALRQRVQAAYADELTEQIPAHLLAVAKGAARPQESKVVSLSDARAAIERKASGARPQWRAAGAIAASIIAGAGLGYIMWGRTVSPLTLSAGGALVAHGQLATALSHQLAAEQTSRSQVQIGVSFLAKSGEYCRTFALSGAVSPSGLACRHGREWQLQILSQAPGANEVGAPEYRTAGSAMSAPILKAVEAQIVGGPLDQAGESEARRRAWTSADR